MRKDEKASISTIKMIIPILIIILICGVGVVKASNATATNITIVFPNGYDLNVITTKTKISDILTENHIALEKNEIVTPDLNDKIGEDNLIQITKIENELKEEADSFNLLEIDDLKNLYTTVVEKIETIEVEIPFETITKDSQSIESDESITNIIQEGENGLKQVTYKITYMNDIEVDKIELETIIIKEPINKIVKVDKKAISRSGTDRMASANPAASSEVSLAQKVSNIEPTVVTLNASAYTASTCGKTATDSRYGYTASGSKAQAWYTVAAGKKYPIGTVVYIPYFEDEPNGGWFVVEDRGGAITNNKIDIYMDSYSECYSFGRRNLECYIYEF